MKLSNLKMGETGIVIDVLGSGAIHRRLLSMGILPGTVIRSVRISPLGDPVVYEIRGFFISLRKREAEYVEVDRIVPLHLVPPKSEVRVVFVDGGVGFIRNLNSMDISVGKKITVIEPCCPMKVRTGLGEFIIGMGMAYRIYVR